MMGTVLEVMKLSVAEPHHVNAAPAPQPGWKYNNRASYLQVFRESSSMLSVPFKQSLQSVRNEGNSAHETFLILFEHV
jgi:hypothetical protein